LQLKCDEPLSNGAFNFSLRRYSKGTWMRDMIATSTAGDFSAVEAEAMGVSAVGGSSPRLSTGGRIPVPRVAAAATEPPKACPLLDLLETLPDLFLKEVLERLGRTDRTMLAQVGRPWLAAVLASGLPRLPKGVTHRMYFLDKLCTSPERLAWVKANWVGRCRLPVSKPVLKAPMESALETIIS